MTTHSMFDGKLQLYRRSGGDIWQCAARFDGARFRESTHETDLDRARDKAELWYLQKRLDVRTGQIVPAAKKERTFREAWDLYLKDVKVLAIGVRTPRYVALMELRMKRHVLPHFGDMAISQINRGAIQTYRVKRNEETIAQTKAVALAKAKTDEDKKAATGHPPARSTMLQEIVHIRQVLKHAEGLGWLPFVPNLSTPYMTQGKKGRRAWFSPEEYDQLHNATGRRITEGKRRGWKSHYEELHDFVLIMANTGLRPDEAMNLEFRDVKVEKDVGTKEFILVIDVRGKTGTGYCKSMPGAVFPFQRLKARREKAAEEQGSKLVSRDKVFQQFDRDTFNKILTEERLKFDRDGKRRTAYSLRHTYISMRLMQGANIHQIANNCRTSVQMIEEHYAAHIKDRIDAAQINVQRPKSHNKPATPANSDSHEISSTA